MDLAAALTKCGIGIFGGSISYPDIADLRGFFATMFYDQTDTDFLLMIDADMQFSAQLVIDMIKFNKPIVGALYRHKAEPTTFVVRSLPDPQQTCNGFMRVAGVGGGVMLIRRDCITKLLEANPNLSDTRIEKLGLAKVLESYGLKRLLRCFDIFDDGDIRLSEDLAFCRRWADTGGEVWASMDHEIGHIGTQCFTAKFSDVVKLTPVQKSEPEVQSIATRET